MLEGELRDGERERIENSKRGKRRILLNVLFYLFQPVSLS